MALDDPRSAAERRAAPLPGRRDEYWRYTNPEGLTGPVKPVSDEPQAAPFAGVAARRLVFVDGVFDAAASDPLEGLRLLSQGVPEGFGALEARGQVPVKRPLAALNTAEAREGLVIEVSGNAAPVHLIYRRGSTGSDVKLHHFVKLLDGADLTLLESGVAGARANIVIEADIAPGAKLHHLRVQGPEAEPARLTHLFAALGAESLLKSFTLSANGRLTRNEAVLWLDGDEGIAHVAGAALGDGGFHHDDTVFITHGAERCESRQVFKKVLKRGAVGVFQGKILVKPGAQKTDGYQISQALLLDEDSQFLAKPELEIYADDVKCSHGSTTGAIDETALFYLRSRGVPRAEAESMLVLSFLADALDEIEDSALRESIEAQLETWLSEHR